MHAIEVLVGLYLPEAVEKVVETEVHGPVDNTKGYQSFIEPGGTFHATILPKWQKAGQIPDVSKTICC